jgi:hypothetical protein
LKSPDFCYKSSVFRTPKKFGFDFHIPIWPNDLGNLRLLKRASAEEVKVSNWFCDRRERVLEGYPITIPCFCQNPFTLEICNHILCKPWTLEASNENNQGIL